MSPGALLLVVFFAAAMCAGQAPTPQPRTLERAGIPTASGARDDAAEAQDRAILERTLYGPGGIEQLEERQGVEMVAAAQRMVDHRKERLDRAERLVSEGVLPRLALALYREELASAHKTLEMAQSRAALIRELAEMARAESAATENGAPPVAEKFAGGAAFRQADLALVEQAYRAEFGKALPVSARGETAVHRALGFDHRGRVDVALDPDQAEGSWLREFLQTLRIPYFAFRDSVGGKATGRHIHIGPASERISRGG